MQNLVEIGDVADVFVARTDLSGEIFSTVFSYVRTYDHGTVVRYTSDIYFPFNGLHVKHESSGGASTGFEGSFTADGIPNACVLLVWRLRDKRHQC